MNDTWKIKPGDTLLVKIGIADGHIERVFFQEDDKALAWIKELHNAGIKGIQMFEARISLDKELEYVVPEPYLLSKEDLR